jgi:hypothetical protein
MNFFILFEIVKETSGEVNYLKYQGNSFADLLPSEKAPMQGGCLIIITIQYLIAQYCSRNL